MTSKDLEITLKTLNNIKRVGRFTNNTVAVSRELSVVIDLCEMLKSITKGDKL